MSTLTTLSRQVEDSLNARFIGRATEIHGLAIALTARLHCVFLGPPGTGKTDLSKAFGQATGLTFWSRLIGQFSVVEDLFGPISLPELQQGIYRQQHGSPATGGGTGLH